MSNILGLWIALGKRHVEFQAGLQKDCQDIEIACPIPQKRVKNCWIGEKLEFSPKVESLYDESVQSTHASLDSSILEKRIEKMKQFFTLLCNEDLIELKIYRSFDYEQRAIVDSILEKRYKDSLLKALKTATSEIEKLDSYLFLKVKRMDHSEKSILSMQLTMLREEFKSQYYGTLRPRDLHDEINKKIFRFYFDKWIDPDSLISLSSVNDNRGRGTRLAESLPRHAAIFCMKKGLTKFWFRAVSSKFLDAILNMSLAELQKYCKSRLSLKLDEIFTLNVDPEAYFQALAERIKNPKFKLPLTLKEVAFSHFKTTKKIKKLRKITLDNEVEEFKTHFGEESYMDALALWKGGVSNTLGSSKSSLLG